MPTRVPSRPPSRCRARVGIGCGIQDSADADPVFDNFDGDVYAVAIYDRALSVAEIRVNADTYFAKGPSDINHSR